MKELNFDDLGASQVAMVGTGLGVLFFGLV